MDLVKLRSCGSKIGQYFYDDAFCNDAFCDSRSIPLFTTIATSAPWLGICTEEFPL